MLSGTASFNDLAPHQRLFLAVLSAALLVVMHIPSSNFGGQGLSLYFNIYFSGVLIPGFLLGLFLASSGSMLVLDRSAFVLLGCIILLTLPIFWNVDIGDVLPRILFLWAGVLLYVYLLQGYGSQKEFVVLLITLSALIQACYGLVQAFYLFGTDILEFGGKERPFGVFQQVNVMASFMGTGIVASGWLATRNLYFNRYRHVRVICYLMAIIGPTVLALILSRSSLIGVSLGLMFLFIGSHKNARLKLKWWASLLLGTVLGALSVVFRSLLTGGPRSIEELASAGDRWFDYGHSIWMILQKPLVGWGYGSFDSSFVYSLAERRMNGESVGVHSVKLDHPHNELLLWAIEGGLPIAGVILAAGGVLLYWMFKTKGMPGFISLALLTPLVVHTMLELPFYHSLVHWFVFMILLWVAFSDTASQKSYFVPYNGAFRGLLVVACSSSALYFATAYHTATVVKRHYLDPELDLGILTEIVNPFALSERLWLAQIGSGIDNAMEIGDETLIRKMAEQAEAYVKIEPAVQLQAVTIMAYKRAGEVAKARELYSLAEYMYPDATEFNGDYSFEDY